jgi:hypothetical protein
MAVIAIGVQHGEGERYNDFLDATSKRSYLSLPILWAKLAMTM